MDIQLPPLRQRKEDVPELVKYFLRNYAAELGVADPSIHAEARAIELAHGNQAKAARWLGISRLTLREKLHQFGIHPAQDHPET